MGLGAKIWNCLCSAVVPQVINPKRADAQNWSHPFPLSLILLSGRIRSTYKILSKSVEKPKSYGMILFASFAPDRQVNNMKSDEDLESQKSEKNNGSRRNVRGFCLCVKSRCSHFKLVPCYSWSIISPYARFDPNSVLKLSHCIVKK